MTKTSPPIKKRLIVAITGASGAIYAQQLLETLQRISQQWDRLHIVMSHNATSVWRHELGNNNFEIYADITYQPNDFGAPFASGSARYDAMIIIPCSMGTLSRVANGISNDLISRAADVTLKERRKLICVIRETPYNLVHIRNMEQLTLAGATICPATPYFYQKQHTLCDVTQTVVNRVIQLTGLQLDTYEWGKSLKRSSPTKRKQ